MPHAFFFFAICVPYTKKPFPGQAFFVKILTFYLPLEKKQEYGHSNLVVVE
jgi:hypothetical protein